MTCAFKKNAESKNMEPQRSCDRIYHVSDRYKVDGNPQVRELRAVTIKGDHWPVEATFQQLRQDEEL